MARSPKTETPAEDLSRAEQLKAAAAEFCRVHEKWADDRQRPYPDQAYWRAAEAMLEVFDEGDIPAECRTLAEAVAQFEEQVDEYDDRENPGENLEPSKKFWKARERIADCLKAPTAASLPPLESIPSLAALPGITDLQIAKIYGFKDRNGQWLPQLVRKELDSPGSVLKAPDGVDGRPWRDPRLPPADGQLTEKQVRAVKKQQATEKKKEAKPCPETPQELWQQGVAVAQAAKMLGLSETEVAQLFGQFEEERKAALDSGEVADANTQAIRELKENGKTIRQIADTLNLPESKVTAALRSKPASA